MDDCAPKSSGEPNSHYRHAFALGRYSQGLSIAKALKQGIAGKVRASLDTALELAPKHAEAHTALALYHAEIIGKIGAMIGGLTYGAKAGLRRPMLSICIGGRCRVRTCDPCRVKAMLYR